jgi:hyaluronan synthase
MVIKVSGPHTSEESRLDPDSSVKGPLEHPPAFHARAVDALRGDGRLHRPDRPRDTAGIPPGEEGDRPVSGLGRQYEIPDVTFKPRVGLSWLPVVAILCAFTLLHRGGLGAAALAEPALLVVWGLTLGFVVAQLVLSWRQRAVTVSPEQASVLDRLQVTVTIPVYNEDRQIVDRTLFSLFRQTRLPDHVFVIDDGSSEDYEAVRDRWELERPAAVRFTWVRQENAGKKHAQAVAFGNDPRADIFITIDSDSALDRHAIEEGLKPFSDAEVVSVAGLEMAMNYRANFLTRAISARSLAFQLFAMSAQSSAGGNVIINPGAFSLYRADMLRDVLPGYLGETFCGQPVILGDDTALTLYALLRGKAVHQPTAVSLPVYPETLSHHLRQWTRWMRASTIRTFWRLRYLRVGSYAWCYVIFTVWSFFSSVALTAVVPLAWPASRGLLVGGVAALFLWPWTVGARLATIRRSDQSAGGRLVGILLLPVAALWYLVVLRQIRFYGIATCSRQSWVTRHTVEVRMDESLAPKESVYV